MNVRVLGTFRHTYQFQSIIRNTGLAWVLVLLALPQASAFQLPVPKDYTVLTQNSGEVSREEKKAFKFILKDVRIDPDYSGAMLDKWDCNCKPGIKKASVSVMWNVLMGEAIEDYKFYWEGTGHYQGEGAFGVSNLYVLLEKYPDLLKRYINDVIPRFKLRFSVKLQDPEYGMQNPGFTKVVSSDLFMVGKSGKLADVSVSSSPGWEKFFTRPDGVRLLDGELERDVKKLKPQFMKSRKITVYAEIFDLEWPRAIIEAIVEEYERREGLLKEEETEKDSRDTEEDGFWTGEEEEEDGSEEEKRAEGEDDFWKGDNDKKETEEEDSYWRGEGMEKAQRKEGFWDGTSPQSLSDGGSGDYLIIPKIVQRDGKFGVVDSLTNRILIPFKYDRIGRYQDGIATVYEKSSDGEKKRIPIAGCHDASYSEYLQYTVNSDGAILLGPTPVLFTYGGWHGLYLVTAEYAALPAEVKEARRKRNRERCMKITKEFLDPVKSAFKVRGGLINPKG